MKVFLSLIKRKVGGRNLKRFFRRPQVAVTKVDAREGYRLWAPTYATETAVSFLDDEFEGMRVDRRFLYGGRLVLRRSRLWSHLEVALRPVGREAVGAARLFSVRLLRLSPPI